MGSRSEANPEVPGGGFHRPGRGDYRWPVLWEIRMLWEDGRLIAAPTAPLGEAWRLRRNGPARGPGPTGCGPRKTGGCEKAQPARKRGKRREDHASTTQQPPPEVSSRGPGLLLQRGPARAGRGPKSLPKPGGDAPIHWQAEPPVQFATASFSLLDRARPVFSFSPLRKRENGGCIEPAIFMAEIHPPASGRTHQLFHPEKKRC